VKNTLTLVNKIPQEILVLIPDYWEDGGRDQGLIKLTHVCRSWRAIFTSCPSLWTRLDCTNVDKTRIYIERSKPLPLALYLEEINDTFYQEEALLLTVPHIDRLKTMSVSGESIQIIADLTKHFSCHAPLLDKLKLSLVYDEAPDLPNLLFNGDLSSLRELELAGVITSLPWRDVSNLTTFSLCHVPEDRTLLTQLLDFFESAPNLRHIHLHDSIPGSSDVLPGRVVSLPHLKKLSIIAQPAHSILLNHLSIPAGSLLGLEFSFSGAESPIPSYLPKSFDNLHNISCVTTINLCFGSKRRFMRLRGPSGELYILGNWICGDYHSGPISHLPLNLFCYLRAQGLWFLTFYLGSPIGKPTLFMCIQGYNRRAFGLTETRGILGFPKYFVEARGQTP
jgi:hypothetical protein